jgi:hypothetical protein
MYHYISERIQSAQNIVVITMPFYQFGILGSPQRTARLSSDPMHESDLAIAAGSNKPHLVFITYDDESRCVMARKRYSRAYLCLGHT